MSINSNILKAGVLSILICLLFVACSSTPTPNTPEAVIATSIPATPVPEEATPTEVPVADRPIEVTDAQMQFGIGSPGTVEVVASGTWPDLCAQLAQVLQQLDGTTFTIELLATPADPDCRPDLLGLPFRIAIPFNMVEQPDGVYTVVVNGVQTSFEWDPSEPAPQPVENLGLTVAYIGTDGNVWRADASGGPPRQISSDATAMWAAGDVVTYNIPEISSDGRFIAVRRDAGEQVPEGLKFQFSLMVYDTETGEARPVYENFDSPPAGFDWMPGTHLLAYGVGAALDYFTIRGEKPDANLTTGIFSVDLDTGATGLLVSPSNGYSLILPVWSPDSRFLSFDELVYMEGRGPFAYYDFETQQYIAWDEPLGVYDWSPDGNSLAYDRLTYTATGMERIFSRPRQDGSEVQVSPNMEQGYAFYPVYSPDGMQIAYLINPGGPESFLNTLVVQDLATGGTRELGTYESIWYLEWSGDGRALVFGAGANESYTVYAYDLVNGSATVIAQGSQPTLAKP